MNFVLSYKRFAYHHPIPSPLWSHGHDRKHLMNFARPVKYLRSARSYMSMISVSRLCDIVMDFDVHLLRKTSSLIGILDRSQRLHDGVEKESVPVVGWFCESSAPTVNKQLASLRQWVKISRRTDVITAFLCCCDRLPGLALHVKTSRVSHKGILCIFLCSQQRITSSLKTLF